MQKKSIKYHQILDALQNLLVNKSIQNISVSEIAQAAGIGKGSIYYYFPSKEAIFEALVERNYQKPLETAKNLAKQTEVSPFTRMALLFQACRSSSSEFMRQKESSSSISAHEQSYLHHKYISHLIAELKPDLTAIIVQGIERGEIYFDYPSALAEMVLIILTVKLDNTLAPGTPEEIEYTLRGLISLLEKGTDNPPGSLNFLTLL